MSGVTSRTLRHYDAIGLLPPAGTASNGYRVYEQGDLLRLQQILLLRELDLGLGEIAQILDHQVDQLEALRGHHRRLVHERDRIDLLVRTVSRTIDELHTQQGVPGMNTINRPENLFEGFDASQYEEEAHERWPEHWEQSKRFTDTLSVEDADRMQREQTAAMIGMAEHMTAGRDVGDAVVQEAVDSAYRTIAQMWTPNAEAFRHLGQMFVDDPRFRTTYDSIAPGLAEYYRDAMAVYASNRLG